LIIPPEARMPLDRSQLIKTKRELMQAKWFLCDAIARAAPLDPDFKDRLRDIKERVNNELEYVEHQLDKLPPLLP
jgi:hypothetical protein